MSLTDISSDLLIGIAKHLTFQECLNLKIVIKAFDLPYIYLFKHSKLFLNSRRLKCYGGYNEKQLHDIIKYSSFNSNQAYELLFEIDQNLITHSNKLDKTLDYDISNVNKENIRNSIKLVQLMLLIIENMYDENSIINNPYTYIYTVLNSTIIDYFADAISKQYNITIDSKCHIKFRYMTYYENLWYLSSINIYVVFLLYLINLNVIPTIKNLKKIRKRINQGFDVISLQNNHKDRKTNTNILELFNFNDAMGLAYTIFLKNNQAPLNLYDAIMQSDNISTFMKSHISKYM
jgi:hypothetical protein